MSHQEASPTPPELIISNEGLEEVLSGAVGKLVEAEEADAFAEAIQPGVFGAIERAHYMQTAGTLRQEARLIGFVLDTIIKRPDNTSWEEEIESRRAKLKTSAH